MNECLNEKPAASAADVATVVCCAQHVAAPLASIATGAAHACIVVVGPVAPIPGVGVALGVWGAGCLALGAGAGVASGGDACTVVVEPGACTIACS